MKHLLTFIAMTTTMFVIMAFANVERPLSKLESINIVKKQIIPLNYNLVEVINYYPAIKSHNDFLQSIGARESSNNYKAINKFGYLGKYQFGRKTLNSLGYRNITNSQFLNSPRIQEEAMFKLLVHNNTVLKNEIGRYSGKVVYGVQITPSGLLAAAHLGGPSSVKKFLRTGVNFKDGLGTGIKDYMVQFSGYDLALN